LAFGGFRGVTDRVGCGLERIEIGHGLFWGWIGGERLFFLKEGSEFSAKPAL
jgi:hypothetical protein